MWAYDYMAQARALQHLKIVPRGLRFSDARFNLVLEAVNKTKTPIKVKAIALDFLTDTGEKIGYINHRKSLRIDGGQRIQFVIPINLNLMTAAAEILRRIKKKQNITLQVKGTITTTAGPIAVDKVVATI